MKSALAHFWFVTIHPFDDGNGRIARAIADLMLGAVGARARSVFYRKASSQVQRERKEYYLAAGTSQKGTLDITPWMEWYP